MDFAVPGSLVRELPAADAVAAKAEGVDLRPQQSTTSRTPALTPVEAITDRPPRTPRPIKFPDYLDLSIHGSLARELPKAEGVAHKLHRNQTKRLASRPNLRAKRVRAHCVEHYPSGGAGASIASGAGLPLGRTTPKPTRIPMRPNLQAYPPNPTAAAQRKKLLFPQAAAVSFAFFSFTIHTPAG